MKTTEVGAVMTTDVVTAAYGTPLRDVIRALGEHRVGGLPVTDEEDRVIGVVSASDLTRSRPHAAGPDGTTRPWWTRLPRRVPGLRRARTAGVVMTAPAVTVRARATVTEASWLMTGHGVERLPVVDDEERLVGIVTRSDLLQAVLRTDGDIERAVRRDVLGTTLWLTPRALAVTVEDGVVTLTGRAGAAQRRRHGGAGGEPARRCARGRRPAVVPGRRQASAVGRSGGRDRGAGRRGVTGTGARGSGVPGAHDTFPGLPALCPASAGVGRWR